MKRILFEHSSGVDDPCVVVFCGIHGNEKAGIKAVKNLLPSLDRDKLRGALYVLSGNIPALEKDQRYIDEDLNRLWKRTAESDFQLLQQEVSEHRDRRELLNILKEIIGLYRGPLYFIDIHTTSSTSVPFITIDDSMINRRFTSVFPVPVVLGIEEYLQGALLSYINQQGFVSLGFEAGEHYDEASVLNAESFLYLVFRVSGILEADPDKMIYHRDRLGRSTRFDNRFYEVVYRYPIGVKDEFKMYPGYENFQKIAPGETIAHCNGKGVIAEKEELIFMPLYQQQGGEGFFFVRKIPSWLLRISAGFRLLRLDALLVLLPGVSWINSDREGMRVNLKTARFLARPLFHLLGYREVEEDDLHLLVYNRERASKKARYPFKFPKP